MAPPASATLQPRRRRRSTTFVILAVFLVVVTVTAVLVDRAVATSAGHPWHDALGFFSVTVPDAWKVTGGISAQPGEQDAEFYWFKDSQEVGAEAYVYIEAKGDYLPAAPCPLGPGYGVIPASVDGWTTFTNPSNDSYLLPNQVWDFAFASADASFNVAVLVEPETNAPDAKSQAQSLIDSLKTSGHGPC